MNPSPYVLVADLAYLFLLFREKREEDGGVRTRIGWTGRPLDES
jgi:hypothetical protein